MTSAAFLCSGASFLSTKMQEGEQAKRVNALCAKVKDLENDWWRNSFSSLPAELRQEMIEEKGLQPSNMRIYGEVAFMLMLLKPAVLISGLGDPSLDVLKDFVASVLNKSGVLEVRDENIDLAAGYVDHSIQTTFFDFNNTFLIYNRKNTAASKIAEKLLSPSTTTISEKEVAQLLDYPVYLKEGEELVEQQRRLPELVEIGYFHKTGMDPTLVMSFGAEHDEVNDKVIPHFKKYVETCKEYGMQLQISISLV